MRAGANLTRARTTLTHRGIDTLRPAEHAYRVPDGRCFGLAVRVATSGIKTWDLSFRIQGTGKVRRISLGRFGDVDLEQARARANQITSAARNGRDLIAEELLQRQQDQSRVTVEALIELYVRRRVQGRLRTAQEIERRLRRALKTHLRRIASDLRRRDIRELLDATAEEGYTREAEKRRQTIGAMFRWGLSQDIVDLDPTAGLTAYDHGKPRDRVLSEDEVRTVWQWFSSGLLPECQATIMKLQLLTGARCGEIAGICVEEIDPETWVWTLPAARSKNKKPRLTPVVGIARDVLQSVIQKVGEGALFRSETGSVLKSVHVGQCLWSRRDRMPVAKFTTHDLRRTVATLLVEMGTSYDLVAAVIGHESGGRETRTLVRHYVHTDLIERKRHALVKVDEWIRTLGGRA
jgi:integrase